MISTLRAAPAVLTGAAREKWRVEEITVLWQDEALLAVNKPAGLRAIPDGYKPDLPHLAGLLQAQYGRVWVVHRLDKDTSGVIVFARSADAHRALNTQFEQRQMHKEYHALVAGRPEWLEITIALPLRVNGDRKHRTVIDHQTGKAAETGARVLETFGQFSLLAALPHTGYTHQIRAHLAAVGLPILNDPLYRSLKPPTQMDKSAGQAVPALPIERLALHAFQLTFSHPLSGQNLTIQAPYFLDFLETVQALSDPKRNEST